MWCSIGCVAHSHNAWRAVHHQTFWQFSMRSMFCCSFSLSSHMFNSAVLRHRCERANSCCQASHMHGIQSTQWSDLVEAQKQLEKRIAAVAPLPQQLTALWLPAQHKIVIASWPLTEFRH